MYENEGGEAAHGAGLGAGGACVNARMCVVVRARLAAIFPNLPAPSQRRMEAPGPAPTTQSSSAPARCAQLPVPLAPSYNVLPPASCLSDLFFENFTMYEAGQRMAKWDRQFKSLLAYPQVRAPRCRLLLAQLASWPC